MGSDNMKEKIVCLDAGHGGTDSGAVGHGRLEKDDNLKLAKSVGKKLKRYVDVKHTRTTDVFDSPSKKAEKGNAFGSDMFVSFHRNSSELESANGYETLVYSESGTGKHFSDYINDEMAMIGFRDRGIKERTDLSVLKKTSMPAVLLETGFITNTNDNKTFDNRFELISDAIASSILYTLREDTTCAYHEYVTAKKKCPVRKGRANTKRKIATIKKGERIKVWYVIENNAGNKWGSVEINGKVGFIYMENVE